MLPALFASSLIGFRIISGDWIGFRGRNPDSLVGTLLSPAASFFYLLFF